MHIRVFPLSHLRLKHPTSSSLKIDSQLSPTPEQKKPTFTSIKNLLSKIVAKKIANLSIETLTEESNHQFKRTIPKVHHKTKT